MDTSNNSIARARHLRRTFLEVLAGKQPLGTYNTPLFLESIYSWPNPSSVVEQIFATDNGLDLLRQSLQSKLDPPFFNDHAHRLLKYLDSPELRLIDSGQYLRKIIVSITEPPIFWNAFRRSFLEGKLDEPAQLSLSWLLLQLLSLPNESSEPYRVHPDTQKILDILLSPSSSSDLRSFGKKLQDHLDTRTSPPSVDATISAVGQLPGGRHDNDFEDFRKISILPTADEIACTQQSFLRPAFVLEDHPIEGSRVSLHIDNQFRLLREDMLYELREELQVALGSKKGRYRGTKITDLYVHELECGSDQRRTKWGLVLICKAGIPGLPKEKDEKARREFLKSNTKFLRHQSLACLAFGDQVVAFCSHVRDEGRLSKNPPQIVIQFEDARGVEAGLHSLQTSGNLRLMFIDTTVFSYEPVLRRLQDTHTLPLSSELFLWEKGRNFGLVRTGAERVVHALERNRSLDLHPLLDTPGNRSIILDDSQAKSLICGLTQQLALIQGPPGTGKSFIGSLLAKALWKYTSQTILVVTYTNHALDDILEGLLNIGIPQQDMLRLGGKSTTATEPLTLRNQPRTVARRTTDQWTLINSSKTRAERLISALQDVLSKYTSRTRDTEVLEHITYADPVYSAALRVPSMEDQDGMKIVAEKGQQVKPDYLVSRWRRGETLGVFKGAFTDPELLSVWKMSRKDRTAKWESWENEVAKDVIAQFCDLAKEYNDIQTELSRAFNSHMGPLLQSKRVLGCTTTAAAKYCDDIQAFQPDVLLVEEAGEILESHILTSLCPETSQIILIGDHKQLRPKVNNYTLTVEKGDGYDLNRSMFERLVLKQYPHSTLSKQHRMRPEISALIRELTYPELVDADSTHNRPDIHGLQDNIVFINHDCPEGDENAIADRRDMSSTTSKHNFFEVHMILKIVRYLGQQGYGTEDLVILTPYLGQLQKIRQALKKDNDPILNDLDSYELIRAGLFNPGEASMNKKPIRLATIDNYQGEEADIVVISLTRSNANGDIGFMISSERLNVLLSRARNGMIMLGNTVTFQNSRKGGELWSTLFKRLRHGKHVYDGLPVRCERHPDKVAVVKIPEDFDSFCPDGGCDAPCGVKLSCGVHECPSKCHQISDHSRVKCEVVLPYTCPNGHSQTYKCSQGPKATCPKCDREARLARKRQTEELMENERREAEQRAHHQRMDELEAEIAAARLLEADMKLSQQRANAILQKRQELEAIRAAFSAAQSSPTPSAPSAPPSSNSFHQPPPPPQPRSDNAKIPPTNATSPTDSPENPISSPSGNGGRSVKTSGQPSVTRGVNLPPTSFPGPNPKRTSKPLPPLAASISRTEWEHRKGLFGVTNRAIDDLMAMTGLEEVKAQVLEIMSKVETSKRQKASLASERFNAVLLGNPGTGKTTVARHYHRFLESTKVIPGTRFSETTGASLANDGVNGAKKLVGDVISAGGGTIFIDEAYQLTSGHSSQGPAVLDYLLAEMENNVGTIDFLLAGYNREMEKFFEHNPGLKSRIPYRLNFADYKDEELMAIFKGLLFNTYQGRMQVEDGTEGLYSRIMIRRLGRRRGQPGFGNARDLQINFARIRGRQANRIASARSNGGSADDYFMSGEDIIGPNPGNVLPNSQAWKKLQGLIGLQAVKDSVKALMNIIEENYQRELMEKEPLAVTLNRVFLGSPGTGKTTVAKLYGQILAELGMLSNGEVLTKNPADFVGAHLGESEKNTKGILANSVGKVLIIDEAYMLYGGGKGGNSGSGSGNNQFKTSVIDTIVAEVQNVPGEDRCVLMLGYRDQMVEMFQNVNPGLSRRFKIEEAFDFEDFDDAQLLQILDLKLAEQDLDATQHAKQVALEILIRMKNRPNFGNAGEIENLITSGKMRCVARRATLPKSALPPDIIFEPQDFDPDYNRSQNASTNLVKLFEDIVGNDDIIQRLANYLEMARACRARDLDLHERIPMNFVFTGPPGTGKTTIARKMGQVFYDMGLLASAEVVECSASDLVGQYVGHTGPKTRALFEKAIGKVLFIDEAYQLSGGHFAQEAVDELVRLLTLPKFKGKLIVILAGYEDDINNLMKVNSGLSSRFPDQVYFKNMDADYCLKVVKKELDKEKVDLPGLGDDTSDLYDDMRELIKNLAELKDWGNARDMMTLSKELINRALLSGVTSSTALVLSENDALDVMRKMLQDRQRRSRVASKPFQQKTKLPMQSSMPNPPSPPPNNTSTNTNTNNTHKPPTPPQQPPPPQRPMPPQQPPRAPSPTATTSRASSPASVASTRGRGQSRRGYGRGGRGRGQIPPAVHNAVPPGNNAQQPPSFTLPRGRGQRQGGRGQEQGGRGQGQDGRGQGQDGRVRGQLRGGMPQPPPTNPQNTPSSPTPDPTQPDPGVTAEEWRQLQSAKQAQADRERKALNEMRLRQQEADNARRKEQADKKVAEDLAKAEAAERDAARRAELQHQREQARLRELAARAAREKAERAAREKQEAERKMKEREVKAQQRLRQMGVCPMGYQWINRGSYYQCAGGAHTVPTSQLGL
ncbi:P-loop containing nucleoside triphosphate hydrolase protein [Cristinia sonorae]|uniref:P-loop containing nucleoside triphosphate hydrolase protein n=1 Tax=Cristinia sonorae TaxID=1940300 RepID=A0A8K0UUT7_9AGAR|nr:P-loop containing nucleoside triphosphate hydrolase protein [Cristinia sonorae]